MHCICNGHSASHSSFSKPEMWQCKDGLDTLANMWHVNVTSRKCYTRTVPKSTPDWLVKKIQNREQNFMYGTVTYITALLLHIVAIHI